MREEAVEGEEEEGELKGLREGGGGSEKGKRRGR